MLQRKQTGGHGGDDMVLLDTLIVPEPAVQKLFPWAAGFLLDLHRLSTPLDIQSSGVVASRIGVIRVTSKVWLERYVALLEFTLIAGSGNERVLCVH